MDFIKLVSDVNNWNDLDNKIKSLTNTTEMGDGLIRYTVGNYTNLQSAMMKHSAIEKAGFENTYIIAFYNGTQISLKKAQELIGF